MRSSSRPSVRPSVLSHYIISVVHPRGGNQVEEASVQMDGDDGDEVHRTSQAIHTKVGEDPISGNPILGNKACPTHLLFSIDKPSNETVRIHGAPPSFCAFVLDSLLRFEIRIPKPPAAFVSRNHLRSLAPPLITKIGSFLFPVLDGGSGVRSLLVQSCGKVEAMKGGKEEGKIMGPLFPRLHVNDADKGGPRAPPRNKMALYEQHTVPSQRVNRPSSALPLPHQNACLMVPSNPLSQVQTSIAASPHLLLEGNPYLSKSPVKAPSKVPLLDCNMNSQQDAVKQKDDECQKLDQKKELQMENIARAPPPTCGERTDGGSRRQVLESGPHSADPPSHSTAPDKNPSPWCLHPPANQWLVPVMSPSEGLIYKPYTGSCAPASSFLAPVYGSCMPFGVPSLAGNFMNTAYGVPASHRPPDMGVLAGGSAIASNYFPAYGIPSMNPIVSTSAVEQVTKLACSRPNGHVDQHSMISCNMSHPRSEEISGCFVKFQASKDTELQASSASSPCEKAQTEATDVLPLFPMAPNKENLVYPSRCSGRDSQAQAIKVVPHNARSAIESAARIFQSIQEERLQHD
ncbi:hypothetical protein GW17_00027476 [Ensete ventricosum]|nr:hypothetical protein GW17_00027476 [Ensete ventricosum]RZR91384.1 hypothetical protein BHM03_00019496 [Ensete ventricosum]